MAPVPDVAASDFGATAPGVIPVPGVVVSGVAPVLGRVAPGVAPVSRVVASRVTPVPDVAASASGATAPGVPVMGDIANFKVSSKV